MTSPKVSLEARGLLPCPFCGGEADIVARNNPMSKWRWSVDCRSSTCGMSGPVESSRATAIALWNARDEQLIRSKVIDEAAGVLRMLIATDEEAAPNGIMDCIDNDGHPYQSAAMAGIITHARLIAEPYDHASSIRQLGERES